MASVALFGTLPQRPSAFDRPRRLNRPYMTACPPEDVLVALLEGRLSEEDAADLHGHMDTCPSCITLLASLVGAGSADASIAPAPPPSPPTGEPPRSMQWEPPAEFDDFKIVCPIGHGGMGRVYLAHDASLDRPVAIKFVAARSPDQKVLDRFVLEARAIARLQHPNVVAIFRIGEVERRPYLAYEFVAGQSLDTLAKPVSWQTALVIALGLARGLAAAHRGGVLHRDIKPANAILAKSGDVKLLDFGIAKLVDESRRMSVAPPGSKLRTFPLASLERVSATADTAVFQASPDSGLTDTHSVLGTPLYLAPELWMGSAATPRSDIYSFGLLLYELCAGCLPTAGLDIPDLARRAKTQDIPPLRSAAPSVPEVLSEIIDRCVRRAPGERYATAEDLLDALESADAVCRAFQLGRGAPSGSPGSVLRQDDAALVSESFARLSPRADALVARFYERLFEDSPAIRRLFPRDLAELRQKLASTLTLAVENMRRPDILDPMLEDLGRRHVVYGTEPAHFDVVGKALLGAIEELDGPGFTRATAEAWGRAYARIAEAMLRGLKEGRLAAPPAPPASAVLLMPPASMPSSSSRAALADSGAPRTRYTRSGDVTIAYQVVGDGPLDILLAQGWVTHLEVAWELPAFAHFMRGLASFSRLILFDKRGSGMSDRDAAGSIEARRDDIEAVLDAVGSTRAAMVGVAAGCAASALFAATRPERTSAVVLYAGAARTLSGPDYSYGIAPASIEQVYQEIRGGWGWPLFIEREAPSMAGDPAFRRWWATYLRMGASPGGAIAILRTNAAVDVRDVLPSIQAPALIVRRSGDRTVSTGASRDMASRIPGARYLEIAGDDHVPFVGDSDALVEEIRRFLVVRRSPVAISSVVSTDPSRSGGAGGSSSRGA